MICLQLVIIFYIFQELKCQETSNKLNIGIVGKHWYELMMLKLTHRKEINKVNLIQINIDFKKPFYTEIQNSLNFMILTKLNIVFGDAVLIVAYASAFIKIPYLTSDILLSVSDKIDYSKIPHLYMLKLGDTAYSKCLLDLLNYFNVKVAAAIIDSSVDYSGFMQPLTDQKEIEVQLWNLADKDTTNIVTIHNIIDSILIKCRDLKIKDIIVKTEPELMKQIVLRAKYYGMLIRPNKWYLASFICHDVNIAAIRQIFSNITFINEICLESYLQHLPNVTNIALINKAIQIFRKMNWKIEANEMFQLYKKGSYRIFNENGMLVKYKFNFHTLNVDEKRPEIIKYVGIWMSNEGQNAITYFNNPTEYIENVEKPLHLRVAAVEEHPHLIVKNQSYVGYGVDLLIELSKIMNFTYDITIFPTMGSFENSNWTGVVKELIEHRADISLGPLVEAMEKLSMIQFTTSFKQREISLVLRKPLASNSLFQFIGPFSLDVWLCFIGSLVLITLSMYGIETLHDKYFNNPEPVKFNLKESSWYTTGCIVKKQIDIFPKSIPGRTIHWITYFFSVIIITSYTAKLAAFLTLKNYPILINSVNQLANLPDNSPIYFGTIRDSDIFDFFRESSFPEYQKIYKIMKSNPNWMVNSSSEGYRRALKSTYVFIWDDSINQYEIFTEPQYECNLMIVGRPFGKRSFSLGISRSLPRTLAEELNKNLLIILESGKLESFEDKWWKSASLCMSKESPSTATPPLYMREVIGVFLILVCGGVVSVLWLGIKLLVHRHYRVTHRTSSDNESSGHGGGDDDDNAGRQHDDADKSVMSHPTGSNNIIKPPLDSLPVEVVDAESSSSFLINTFAGPSSQPIRDIQLQDITNQNTALSTNRI